MFLIYWNRDLLLLDFSGFLFSENAMCHDSATKIIFKNRLNFLWQKRYPVQ